MPPHLVMVAGAVVVAGATTAPWGRGVAGSFSVGALVGGVTSGCVAGAAGSAAYTKDGISTIHTVAKAVTNDARRGVVIVID